MDINLFVSNSVEEKSELYTSLSDQIWSFAEIGFNENQSSAVLMNALKSEGFSIQSGIAGLTTGFMASFGSGNPVIAFLGEFDALAELSQEAGVFGHSPVIEGENGHGCGHNLLGVGSLAAAVAVKEYLQSHPEVKGTVHYFGCPAEESGYGKAFLVREGYFRDVDAALSWHPHILNVVPHGSTNAVVHATFNFKGISAHAGAFPHLGRSALDAVELMNVGANYMREHMVDQARLHYAITNAGGISPNVVQAEAEVTYLVRAPQITQVQELFNRLVRIAEGAALMTGTQMEYVFEGACANIIPNNTLESLMHQNLSALGVPKYNEEEISMAKSFYQCIPEQTKKESTYLVGPQLGSILAERPLAGFIVPYSGENLRFTTSSTDVGDVSWNVPTAQCLISTLAFGTPKHTWLTVAQGKTSYAHKGMLLAAKTMASTAIEAMLNPSIIEKAKSELKERLRGEKYICLVPTDVHPPAK
ncbi:aminobenzoyl-glutamate utilization protein B [Paenibacillus sp. PvP094]|uniref:M20 family metallopeptidase n=1 Tax=Paenibacillus TaxID=44249 RepID=UPI000FD79CF5|nr:M20 family metallopeptidase [Paenibacillus illinoisensis]